MKKTFYLVCVLAFALFLSGCCLKHEWVDASCEEAKHCAKCGKTKGEPLGHEWAEATCTDPKTCTRCGATEGEALGHDWEDATCTEPKVCKVCGTKEGDALGHDWKPATLDAPKTCSRCGVTEGEPVHCEEIIVTDIIKDKWESFRFNENTIIGYNSKKEVLGIYDYDGNLIKNIDFVEGKDYNSWSYDVTLQTSLKNKVAIITTFFDKSNNGTIILYDELGEEVGRVSTNASFPDWLTIEEVVGQRYILLWSEKSKKTIVCIDTETMSIVDKSEVEGALDYDKDKYGYCYKEVALDEDRYLIANSDKSEWGFADKDLNEIKMYKDASDFSYGGYALVSDDCEKYSIIDKDFNVIAKDCIEGESSWWPGGSILAVKKGEETHYYLIK